MSKLVKISAATHVDGLNEIGDIVAVLPDDWVLSEKEKVNFEIIIVPETTAVIDLLRVKVKTITKAATLEWTDKLPEEKRVWQDTDGKVRDLIDKPVYDLCHKDGVIKETFSRYAKNLSKEIQVV